MTPTATASDRSEPMREPLTDADLVGVDLHPTRRAM